LCRPACVLLVWQFIVLCCLVFVGTDIALCRAAWDLLVLEVHCVVLLGFVGTRNALCRAAWVLLVLAEHCVVLLRFSWYWQCIVSRCFGFVDTGSAF